MITWVFWVRSLCAVLLSLFSTGLWAHTARFHGYFSCHEGLRSSEGDRIRRLEELSHPEAASYMTRVFGEHLAENAPDLVTNFLAPEDAAEDMRVLLYHVSQLEPALRPEASLIEGVLNRYIDAQVVSATSLRDTNPYAALFKNELALRMTKVAARYFERVKDPSRSDAFASKALVLNGTGQALIPRPLRWPTAEENVYLQKLTNEEFFFFMTLVTTPPGQTFKDTDFSFSEDLGSFDPIHHLLSRVLTLQSKDLSTSTLHFLQIYIESLLSRVPQNPKEENFKEANAILARTLRAYESGMHFMQGSDIENLAAIQKMDQLIKRIQNYKQRFKAFAERGGAPFSTAEEASPEPTDSPETLVGRRSFLARANSAQDLEALLPSVFSSGIALEQLDAQQWKNFRDYLGLISQNPWTLELALEDRYAAQARQEMAKHRLVLSRSIRIYDRLMEGLGLLAEYDKSHAGSRLALDFALELLVSLEPVVPDAELLPFEAERLKIYSHELHQAIVQVVRFSAMTTASSEYFDALAGSLDPQSWLGHSSDEECLSKILDEMRARGNIAKLETANIFKVVSRYLSFHPLQGAEAATGSYSLLAKMLEDLKHHFTETEDTEALRRVTDLLAILENSRSD